MAPADPSFVPEAAGLDNGDTMSPRSVLFSLEPIGIGTPTAEGLISYIIRLAEAYSVSPRRLIKEEFVKCSPEIGKCLQASPFFNNNARCINGLHRYSEIFADIVEKLCGLSAAKNLTLLPLKALLPFNGVGMSAQNSRWCSSCYAEMRESRRQLYQPLAWSLDLYQACPKHGKRMMDRCPSCDKRQYSIPRIPLIGYCCYCGTWLGKRPDKPLPASPFESWIATAIEKIIAELPRLGNLATRDRFLGQLNAAIIQYANGSRSDLCRQIGLPQAGFQIWITNERRPTLARWLAISYALDVNPVRFLEEDFASVSKKAALRQLPCALRTQATCARVTATQRQAIQAELDCIAEAGNGAISVTKLAERHQLSRHQLQARWPDQCRKISSDYRKAAGTRWNEELARRCCAAMETVDALLERGVYPSQNVLRGALKRIGLSLVNPAIRDACKQQLNTRLGENEGHS